MLIVNTLGKFRVTNEDVILDDNALHSPMLVKLFIYMVLHREKDLTTEEIADAVWMDGEIDNPAGALKNLMYRLRKCLNDTFGVQEYILTNRGSYHWNPDIKILLDVEEFEKVLNSAKSVIDQEKDLEKYEEAIMIYEGDFMSSITDLHWAQSLNSYYHSMYLSAVKTLAEMYLIKDMYEEMEQVCNKALEIDITDEQLYYYQIKARMCSGKVKLAFESYEAAKKVISQELGIYKSDLLEEIYQEMLTSSKGTVADEIEEVHADVKEENPDGVFFCGYPVFKEVYQLEARKSIRSGIPNQLILFTVETLHNEAEAIQKFRIKQGMERLEQVMKKSLRLGDVASKYSDSQYVLLVPNCTNESGHLVASRIIAKMNDNTKKYSGIKIKVNVEEVNCERVL